MRFERPMIFGS